MKNLFTTLLLIFSLSLFSGEAIAQSTDSTETEVCYDTSIKIVIKEKKKKDDKVKEKKPVTKNNCFEFKDDGSIVMTNSKGKEFIYDTGDPEIVFTANGLAYLYDAYMNGKNYKILLDYGMSYIAIYDLKKNKIMWYYMEDDFE